MKITVFLADYYTEEHRNAMVKLINKLKSENSSIIPSWDEERRCDSYQIEIESDTEEIFQALSNADCFYYEKLD